MKALSDHRNYMHTAWQEGGGLLPYIRYVGMCRPKGYGF